MYRRLLRNANRLRSAQYAALKAVNRELISLYWYIGRMIAERQQGAIWGKAGVKRLASDLRQEFPGMQGFSASNLWRMKVFFQAYAPIENLVPLVRKIWWTHNILIFERCKDDLQREFYIRMTRKFGWSKNVLIHHIENQSYEKTLLGQTNFDKTLPDSMPSQVRLALSGRISGRQQTTLGLKRSIFHDGADRKVLDEWDLRFLSPQTGANNL